MAVEPEATRCFSVAVKFLLPVAGFAGGATAGALNEQARNSLLMETGESPTSSISHSSGCRAAAFIATRG